MKTASEVCVQFQFAHLICEGANDIQVVSCVIGEFHFLLHGLRFAAGQCGIRMAAGKAAGKTDDAFDEQTISIRVEVDVWRRSARFVITETRYAVRFAGSAFAVDRSQNGFRTQRICATQS